MQKTILITGASKGIGKQIAIEAYNEGLNVVVNYNTSRESAESLVAKLGSRAIAIKADVSNPAEIDTMFDIINSKFGGVDILVNNAGVAHFAQIQDEHFEDVIRTISVNLVGQILCTKACVPYMLSKMWGRIVNISSIWGVVGSSCESVYSAAKGGIISFTKALAKELGSGGITVNCVCPGLIDTEMNANLSTETRQELISHIPLHAIGSTSDVSEIVRSIIKASYMTGQVITVDGGMIL